MKLRGFGLVCLVGAALLGILAHHMWSELRNSPFGYELGSVAFPVPPYLRAIWDCSLLFGVAGLILAARDFINWMRKKPDDNTN
jgi:hypothetical protein